MDDIRIPIPAGSTRFMDQLRADMRARGYAFPTERTYLHWIKRFILFNQRRHPNELGKAEIEGFLNYLAVDATVSPSTQRTALNALMYLYTKFLGREPQALSFSYAKPTRRLPTVLTHEEAKDVLTHMSGTPRLMAPWNANIPLLRAAPHGNFYFLPRASVLTRVPVSFAAITYIIRRCVNTSGLL